ncbi:MULTISPECIES: hypothetical protein [Rhodopirellula]|uniref:hypothetical protein n=1 Tax=Rhodopirellula TaxID=265488 RepID=UPI00118193FA|nr:hypothetical protein [Rhodopirellula sallentina]
MVALASILIYLTLRFIALAFSSDEDFATELPGFFTYSILMISGTVLVTATLAGFIEFLELLLDVKSDLATARAMDRQL